ncbi:class I SAM-dependent methyltransferase, partial [Mycobacterium sp.]|uniref:class I SAM-dependent methyltransferase n=1 Tax=Mycobacterium sp. TaxID=1785 RepID=UPI003C765EBB
GHSDPIINDPVAIKLVESIDVDFEKFGRKGPEMALRSLAVDKCAISYLTKHAEATVVALAEGFQTSFWRLNSALPDGNFRWVSLDLAPVIDIRQRLLPHSARITYLAQSALDYSWIDKIDSSHGVFITAEGLLMYLQPQEALGLIAQCAQRFPGGQMFFDLPPTIIKRLSSKGLRSSRHYKVPPMPFSLSVRQLADLANTMPGVRAVHDVPMPKGRGVFFGIVYPAFWRFGPTKPFRGAYTLLEFG